MPAIDDQRDVDMCVFIGRFRPFHNGHLFVVREALRQAKVLKILVGSANQPRSLRNPFTFHEVREMIFRSLTPSEACRVHITPLEDADYSDELWVQSVQSAVGEMVRALYGDKPFPRVSLIGYAKDHTSYYLKLFPQWASIGVPQHKTLSATTFREALFKDFGPDGSFMQGVDTRDLPVGTFEFLTEQFIGTPAWCALVKEAEAVEAYKAQFAALPYPPIFVTVDTVVIQSGHVLMIKRGKNPGAGLWALPGGYLNADEPISAGWVRELEEETGLVSTIGERAVRGSHVATSVFDNPHRDDRGRMITHAHLVHLPPGQLPAVKGMDDAVDATWIPLAALDRRTIFADHYSIIRSMVAKSLQF
jgi:bifunctional NMN adenylyltransferase/nudix hydrolase